MKPNRLHFTRLGRTSLAVAVSLCLNMPAYAGLTMPNTPLSTGTELPPNIMFILDDSGSMAWDHMPGAGSDYNTSLPYRGDLTGEIRFMAPNVNTLWYDPLITYTPGTKASGTSYPSMAPGCIRNNGYADAPGCSAFPGTFDGSNWPTPGVTTGGDPKNYPVFYVLNGAADPAATADPKVKANYKRYELKRNGSQARYWTLKADGSPSTSTDIASFTWTTPSGKTITRTIAEEASNYSNWYTYYRTRTLMAKSAASIAFGELKDNYRVGFNTIWNRLPYNIPVGTDGGLFKGTNRSDWFSKLFAATANSGTPLRSALKRTGDYFSNSGASGPYGPESGASQVSCRQNFAILTTDGYWNSDDGFSVGNPDGTDGPTITGEGGSYTYAAVAPYTDGYSDTLADVAMKYWKNDLRADLTNNVPSSPAVDPAFWQHMVTFGISIGMQGTLDPAAGLPASWPKPGADQQENIDDLWHAAVNSHGSFIAARNPQTFYTALRNALDAIGNRVGSFSNISTSSTVLKTGTRLFQAKYTTGIWTGEVEAFDLDAAGNPKKPALWAASGKIPAAAVRKIYFKSDGGTKPFVWANLSGTQQTALVSTDVVDYLRGDQSKESVDGFRIRPSRLGDVVDSSPVYDPTSGTLYFAANDGMLHAIDANDGSERFAIVPTQLFPDLHLLSERTYTHRFFFDGDIAVGTLKDGKRIVVANLGQGGAGIIAVDVTDVGNPQILWEFSEPDLGLTVGTPVLTATNDGNNAVLLPNGVNSTNDKAMLFVLDATSGTILKKIDTGVGTNNGLSSPRGWDEDRNGTVDTVYAGDLHGNLWKFDLSASSSASWDVATIGGIKQSLFQAKDAANKEQPITGGISIAPNTVPGPNYGLRFVFFGTGRYLTASDSSDLSTQTWYGIIDADTRVTGRAALAKRTITDAGLVDGNGARVFSKASAGDMSGKSGWYLDFLMPPNPPGTAEGERVIGTPKLLSERSLMLTSMIPFVDPCSAGGSGWVNIIDPFTGGRIDKTIIDMNGDGKLTVADDLDTADGKKPVGSYRKRGGGGRDGVVLEDHDDVKKYDCAPGADCDKRKIDPLHIHGRISWREIVNQR